MPTNVHKLKVLHTKAATGYRFIDRDPICDLLVNYMDGCGKTDQEIAALAMVTWQTVRNIREKTKRPQNFTCDRIFKACGYYRRIVQEPLT